MEFGLNWPKIFEKWWMDRHWTNGLLKDDLKCLFVCFVALHPTQSKTMVMLVCCLHIMGPPGQAQTF